MKKLIALLLLSCAGLQAQESLESTKTINLLVDSWHLDASKAKLEGYFLFMTDDCIFIGTDKSELWNKQEFYNFAKPYFDKGQAWSFKATERNVYFNSDNSVAWFDELLDTWMGVCRASGVLVKVKINGVEQWKLKHYQLSVTIDNDLMQDFIKISKK